MENKDYKYVKRDNPVISLVDIRLEYKKETGIADVPLTHGFYDEVEYIVWLEDKLVDSLKLKRKLIPFEPITTYKS